MLSEKGKLKEEMEGNEKGKWLKLWLLWRSDGTEQ